MCLTLALAGNQEYKAFCITVPTMVLDRPERERQQALGRQDSGDRGCLCAPQRLCLRAD